MFELGPKWDDEWNITKDEKFDIKLPSEHTLKIQTQKRRGKVVTIAEPFFIKKAELKSLLKRLKSQLGVGGTAKENSIELQGEHTQKLKEFLIERGFNISN
jgi:translation initiation factor 1